MSDFWDKNKDSIKSGLITAGKQGYQGTKYVAKTSYHMGKSQYDAHKGKGHQNNNNTNPNTEKNDGVSIDRLNDPKDFPAPPLRQGQKQYAGNGQIVCAEEAPILNIPPESQDMNQQRATMNNQYQNQSQQTYVNYQYSTMSTANFQNDTQSQQLGNTPQQTQYMQPTQHFRPQPLLNEIQRPSPAPPVRPPIPSRHQTINFESSGSINSTSSSTGPHFEVRPFNREEYEEEKKQKAIIVPQIDLSKIAPPPTHRDRSSTESSTRNSPSVTGKSSQKSTPLNYSSSSVVSSSPTIGPITTTANTESCKTSAVEVPATLTVTDKSVENVEQNKKEKDEVNNTVSGAYHEPAVNFAPPPQPYRRISNEKNRELNNGYSSKMYSSTPISNHQSVSQPPPLLPKRNANNKMLESYSSQPIEHNIKENNLGDDDVQTNNPITGIYTTRNVNFQPPPKPFRRNSNIGGNRELTKRSSSSYGDTLSVSSSLERNKQTSTISEDTKAINSSEISNKEEPSIKPAVRPISAFTPPPKPFRPATSRNTLQDKANEIQGHEQSAKHHNDFSKIQPYLIDSLDHNDSNNPNNRSKDETTPIYNSSSYSNPPSNSPHTFIQELNSTITNMSIHDTRKHKNTSPPLVKPKPQSLNKISLEKIHSVSISKNHSEPSKKQPPVVKPKPKNLENILNNNNITDKTFINSCKTSTSDSILDHPHVEGPAKESSQTHSLLIREQPPIPPSRRTQPPIPQNKRKQPSSPKYHTDAFVPTHRRARMPLPDEIYDNSKESVDSQSDDDINPFAIYKKEAVPASHDRIHNN